MILLDTNVVSEPMRSKPDQNVLAWLDAQAAESLYLTTISLAELLLGVASLPTGKRRKALAGIVIPSRLPMPRSRRLLLPGSSVWLRATRRHFRRPASQSSTRGLRDELAIRLALGAGARLLKLYVTKTQSSVVVPKVVIDEVQKPISGRPERSKRKVSLKIPSAISKSWASSAAT